MTDHTPSAAEAGETPLERLRRITQAGADYVRDCEVAPRTGQFVLVSTAAPGLDDTFTAVIRKPTPEMRAAVVEASIVTTGYDPSADLDVAEAGGMFVTVGGDADGRCVVQVEPLRPLFAPRLVS